MASQPDSKNELVFLGINFNNFFKNCGCVKRSDEEALLADTTDNDALPILQNPKPKKFREKSPGRPNEDSLSMASSTDWTDLEEIPLPGSPSGHLFATLPEAHGNVGDDFYTQEPIDFEDLKKITRLDKDEEDEEKSSKSGLSRSSKKISKKDPAAAKADAKAKGKAGKKEIKEEKGKGKRNPWQPHEDAKVLELVAKYGQSWAVVASMMEGRTGKQIRDRFLNKLKSNIRRGDWTPEEDKLLLTLYYQLGHKWSKIATYLPGRTEGQVKNRFYSHIKKRIDGHAGPEVSEPYSGAYDSLQSPESNFAAQHGANILSGQVEVKQGSVSPDRYFLGDDTMKDLVSPTGSAKTATTQVSRVSADVQVNTILDKLTGYLDTKVNINEGEVSNGYHYMQPNNAQQQQQMQMQNVALFNNNNNNNANEEIMRMEQLQHRKGQLEYLLAQTLREMGTMKPAGNMQQNAWGGWS